MNWDDFGYHETDYGFLSGFAMGVLLSAFLWAIIFVLIGVFA